MCEEAFAEGSRGDCTVYGHAQTIAATPAALCNGTAAHGFELDDLISSAVIHPGSVVVVWSKKPSAGFQGILDISN